MLITPDQASNVWCPMVRMSNRESIVPQPRNAVDVDNIVVVSGCNTDVLENTRIPASCRCVADKCAMWRWGEYKDVAKSCVVDDPTRGPGGKKLGSVTTRVPHAGYCGLAGVPVA